MNIVLAAINAKYIHSNLAVYSIKRYAEVRLEESAGAEVSHIEVMEFTINHLFDDLLGSLYQKKPDILAFSCYIWNIAEVKKIVTEYRKLDKKVKLWLGGPEVSYHAYRFLKEMPQIDGIMIGEGEESFYKLLRYYQGEIDALSEIPNIVYRDEERIGTCTDVQELIKASSSGPRLDLSDLPFAYGGEDGVKNFKHRIIYYESSRGCPFSCSYCLSSVDKKLRFRSRDLVFQELSYFLEQKVVQVKFVDRTFNCNVTHAMEIWQYIKDHDNHITNFHFEIAADLMTEEGIRLLNSMRPGLVQLEIGVQSTNCLTIDAICRKMDFELVKKAVTRIKAGNNILQHLDLIAGLPHEDYASFHKSFLDVYAMKPDELQLGFLKVLKGSPMEENTKEYGIVYQDREPNEVLYTSWLSYDEIIKLKQIEEMVEVYYNSRQFKHSILFLEHYFDDAFVMYEKLAAYYEEKLLFAVSHARIKRYELLLDFFKEHLEIQRFDGQKEKDAILVLRELLVYDLYLREKMKARPSFAANDTPFKIKIRQFLEKEEAERGHKALLHMERFTADRKAAMDRGIYKEKEHYLLFDYSERNPLTQDASVRLCAEII